MGTQLESAVTITCPVEEVFGYFLDLDPQRVRPGRGVRLPGRPRDRPPRGRRSASGMRRAGRR